MEGFLKGVREKYEFENQYLQTLTTFLAFFGLARLVRREKMMIFLKVLIY